MEKEHLYKAASYLESVKKNHEPTSVIKIHNAQSDQLDGAKNTPIAYLLCVCVWGGGKPSAYVCPDMRLNCIYKWAFCPEDFLYVVYLFIAINQSVLR